MTKRGSLKLTKLGIGAMLLLPTGQLWATATTANDAAELETIMVVGSRLVSGVGLDDQVASSLSSDEIRKFSRDNVGDALNLLSGITLSQNSRNEKLITVRGFDSRQVPLFIDGIPVYVPYDGYIDFNRFTTADLAAIQVAKGFSSVAYGPNALGGAINLISRKPQQAFEADATLGIGAVQQRQAAVNLGSRQGKWYAQGGASFNDANGFKLADDFTPTATEDGGVRDNSQYNDSKLSFKLGYLPSEGEEYSLSVYRQQGEKGQPPSAEPAYARYWQWPFWDKEGAYFISRTKLSSLETLTVRAYHDSYDNEVTSFTDGTYTKLKTQGKGSVGSGRSIYHDTALGGSVILESLRLTNHQLRVVSHYKADKHQETDATGHLNTQYEDTLFSIAAEDNLTLTDNLLLAVGLSYHKLTPDAVFNDGNLYSLPKAKSATDSQIGLFYDLGNNARLYSTITAKTRLPSLKDRYSQRLGSFIENPNLQPEQATNYELGYQHQFDTNSLLEAAVFFSDVSDKIQAVANVSGILSQMQNIGRVESSGIELGMQHALYSSLTVGGNYTYTKIKNKSGSTNRVTDMPKHKVLLHGQWQPIEPLSLLLQAEYNSERFASNTVELAGFTLFNAKANYQFAPNWQWSLGVNNLTDKNYALAEGFPAAGRSWFTNLYYKF